MPITFDMTTFKFTKVPLPLAGTMHNPVLIDHTPLEMALIHELAATKVVLGKSNKELNNPFIKLNCDVRAAEQNSFEYQVHLQHDLIFFHFHEANFAESKEDYDRLGLLLDEVNTIMNSSQHDIENHKKCAICMVDVAKKGLDWMWMPCLL
jgi:hypothetical protein